MYDGQVLVDNCLEKSTDRQVCMHEHLDVHEWCIYAEYMQSPDCTTDISSKNKINWV